MKIIVKLTDAQLEEAALAGVKRRVDAITKYRQTPHPGYQAEIEWEYDIRGAIAEYAVCLAFGQRFSGYVPRNIRGQRDAGPLEVRTLCTDLTRGLAAKWKDPDDQRLVLAIVKKDRVLIVGWETAGAVRAMGKANKYDRHELPQSELRSVDTLGYPIQFSEQVREYLGA